MNKINLPAEFSKSMMGGLGKFLFWVNVNRFSNSVSASIRERLLFIPLSNIGDAVMSTAVLEVLHRRFPAAAIDIVADPRSSMLFAHCPYRGEIVERDKKHGWMGYVRLIRRFRQHRYRLVVDLKTAWLPWLLRSQHRCVQGKGAERKKGHAVDELMGVLRPEFTDSTLPATRLWLDSAQLDFARQALSPLPGKRWLAVGSGANWPPKIWPTERFQELLVAVRDCFDGVILLGNRDDAGRAEAVASGLALPWLNLVGRTDLLQCAAMLSLASYYVGNDSGLGHMASAVGTPTLTLFGPTDSSRFHPWGDKAAWLEAPGGHLPDLTSQTVAEQLRAHLKGFTTA
jgi:ADP-heptose:LPS heptosyltransferase